MMSHTLKAPMAAVVSVALVSADQDLVDLVSADLAMAASASALAAQEVLQPQ